MKRRYWVLLALVAAVLVVAWWLPIWPSRVTLRFVRYAQDGAERTGIFVLENGSSKPIVYAGSPGEPFCYFREYTPSGPSAGPAVHSANFRNVTGSLAPGERLEFSTRLRWHYRAEDPLTGPFEVGLDIMSWQNNAFEKFLSWTGVRKERPFEEKSWLWSNVVTP